MTIEPDTEVIYKVSAPYAAAHEGAILWNDSDLGISWPAIGTPPTLSAKDQAAVGFAHYEPVFSYGADT